MRKRSPRVDRTTLTVLACIGLFAAKSLADSPKPTTDGNRLAYLDSNDPYYVHRAFPKLITPQWVGEEGAQAVVVLAVDDMNDNSAKYEAFLRPIIDRLEKTDGKAHLSIMTNSAKADDPIVKKFIEEGVSIEVHSIGHPCPILSKGNFDAAKHSFDDCIDLLAKLPDNKPVAFRTPCCDSLNTPSPRFFAEIFNKTTANGNFLTIDSSVFNVTTPNDPELPRDLVFDNDGGDRFRKYLPFPSFVNTIVDYPYPYVLGGLCWEFPCSVPSDWEAFHVQKDNPKTVEDMKAALDAVVAKQGVMNLVFHPHNWIQNRQIVELIDHAARTHGRKVKFLNFKECIERIEKNLLVGGSLRDEKGFDSGVRLIDVNSDGFLDVVVGQQAKKLVRIWDPKAGRFKDFGYELETLDSANAGSAPPIAVRFGVIDGKAFAFRSTKNGPEGLIFAADGSTTRLPVSGLELDGRPIRTLFGGKDQGVRFRDLDGDGTTELIVGNPEGSAVFKFTGGSPAWKKLNIGLPAGASIVTSEGGDAGLRFVDVDEDLRDDVVFSNDSGFGLYLFDSFETGWSRVALKGFAGASDALPKFVHEGRNAGAWFHSRSLWVQNENTATMPDLVDRRSFNQMLWNMEPRGKSPEASLASIRVKPGFSVELAAAEPLVNDPIAIDWDPSGALWVVEMADYPLGVDGKGGRGGQIRKLFDDDRDGRFDRSVNFLEGLGYPTGVFSWRKGVIVSCAPDIFYAEDANGDGKADKREVLFTGFVEGNPQHRVNGFELGLDGWIHGANGDSGGRILSKKTGKVVDIQGRDFRFKPDTGEFETESGGSQFGRHRDDWGNWFSNNNPNWLWHNVLSEREVARNPSFASGSPRQMIDSDARLYPISRTVPRFNSPDSVNRVTSANSPTPYRDNVFGPAFERSVFVSEPVHNVVHRVNLEPVGGTFQGGRESGELDREFLASSDNWFRPTMLKTGPDGALWIVDMYRAVIEHPEWIPDDWEAKLDLRAGADKGRIYRVRLSEFLFDKRPTSKQCPSKSAIGALASPNGTVRDLAMRLILQAKDSRQERLLRAMLDRSLAPASRVQILATLAVLGAIDARSLANALVDLDPRVRGQGLKVCGPLLEKSPELAEQVVRLADDPDAGVRFQLALALGDWPTSKAAEARQDSVERRRRPLDTSLGVLVIEYECRNCARSIAFELRSVERAQRTSRPASDYDVGQRKHSGPGSHDRRRRESEIRRTAI